MTDELRTAAERYRRGEDGYRNPDPTLDPTGWMASAAHDGDARFLAATYLAEQPVRESISLRCRYILGTCRGVDEMRAEARAILDLLGVVT